MNSSASKFVTKLQFEISNKIRVFQKVDNMKSFLYKWIWIYENYYFLLENQKEQKANAIKEIGNANSINVYLGDARMTIGREECEIWVIIIFFTEKKNLSLKKFKYGTTLQILNIWDSV